MDALVRKRDISGWGVVREDYKQELKSRGRTVSMCALRFGHPAVEEEKASESWCTPADLWTEVKRKLDSPKNIDWERASKHFATIHYAAWADFHIFCEPVERPSELEVIFNGLVKHWQEQTGGYSVTTRRYAHPSYHAILILKKDVVPLILQELQQRPDWWFEALKLLTKEDPVKPGSTFAQAVDAWIDWGKRNKHIP